MIEFLNPIGLWGLAGLLVPVGIHLLSRKEGKVIRFGSLRHLKESHTTHFRSIRLNEIALLVMRCLLLTAIVLLLAGIQVHRNNPEIRERWLVVEKGIEQQPEFIILRDSLQHKGYEVHYLASGFPLQKDSLSISSPTDYWELTRELKSKALDDIIVASYGYASKFNGERSPLPDNIRWITFPSESHEFAVEAISIAKDTALVNIGYSTHETTSFRSRRISLSPGQKHFKLPGIASDSIPVQTPDSISVTVVYDDVFDYDQKIMLAGLKAVQSTTPHKVTIITKKLKEWNRKAASDWVILLTKDTLAPSSTKNTLVFRECTEKNLPLLVSGASASIPCGPATSSGWIITKRLNEEVALKENLTLQLADLLLPRAGQEIIITQDRRVLPELMMWSTDKQSRAATKEAGMGKAFDHLLALFILITLIAERWLAYKRNQ